MAKALHVPNAAVGASAYSMSMAGALRGLTRVPDSDLEALLRAVHAGRIKFPLQGSGLLILGLNRLADEAAPLLGLDERGVRAVIAVVLAERRHVRRASSD